MRLSIINRLNQIVVLCACTVALGQTQKKEDSPKPSVASSEQSQIRVIISKDFPQSNVYKFDDLPLTAMVQNWSIEFDENKEHPHHYFQASLYQNHEQVEALYEDNGRLISSKIKEHFIDGPRAIRDAVSSIYSGWTAKPVMEKIDFIVANQKIVYYVEIVKGHHSKKIALDVNGTVLKEYNLM